MTDFWLDWYKMMIITTGMLGLGMLIKKGLATESIVMIALCTVFTALFFIRRNNLLKECHLMNTQAQRVQMTLFPVESVDNVFGITSKDHTCVKCGHAMMHVEDSEGAYYGFPPAVIDEVCSNAKCLNNQEGT